MTSHFRACLSNHRVRESNRERVWQAVRRKPTRGGRGGRTRCISKRSMTSFCDRSRRGATVCDVTGYGAEWSFQRVDIMLMRCYKRLAARDLRRTDGQLQRSDLWKRRHEDGLCNSRRPDALCHRQLCTQAHCHRSQTNPTRLPVTLDGPVDEMLQKLPY